MKYHKLLALAMIVSMLSMLGMGCSDDSSPVAPVAEAPEASLSLCHGNPAPSEVAITATLYVFCDRAYGNPIDVHRVTDSWEEMTVTWNSFGGAYDPTIEESFVTADSGWQAVDVTALATSWIDGSAPNYGLLLDQVERTYPRNRYTPRESGTNQPYIEICYSDGTCEQIVAMADTYVWEAQPDLNRGDYPYLFTGWQMIVDKEKQALLRFEMPEIQISQGCTRTIGYWKNHTGCRRKADLVSPLLPIWLGEADGAKSLYVDDARMAVRVLKMRTYGRPWNGTTKLSAQLLAAKLNIANGASGDAVEAVIAKADAFLADRSHKAWRKMNWHQKRKVLRWKNKLNAYNNGRIGPGHCD